MALVRRYLAVGAISIQAVVLIATQNVLANTPAIAAPPAEHAASSDFAKATELTMPVKDAGFKLGEVIVLAGTDGSVRIQEMSLITAIRGLFRAEALQALEAKLPGAEYITLAELTDAGLKATYNPTDLEILIVPTVEQRPRGEVTGAIKGNRDAANVAEPANFSGFVNAHVGVAYERGDDARSGDFEFPAILLDGAARWQGLVVEGEAQFNVDGTYARRNTRLVYDLPDQAIRLSGGDLLLPPGGLFVTPPLLGIAIERSYADLRPTQNVRPTGKRSFRVERASEVRVLVNNREVRRLQLAPGEYDLNDLPLTSGTNEIKLLIKDEFGKEESVDFSILFNRTLLDSGVSEWSLAAGTRARRGALEPEYDEEEPLLAGALRSGVSETLTTSLDIQASMRGALGSVNALNQTPIGLLNLGAGGSAEADGGFGWLLAAELDLNAARVWEAFGSIHLGAELRSGGFKTSFEDTSDGGAQVRFDGSLSQPLPGGFSLGVSGYYVLAQSALDHGFGTSVSLSHLISQELSLGISGSYESMHREPLDEMDLGGFSLLGRLNYRPSMGSNLSVEHNGVSKSTTASIGASFQEGASLTNFDVDIEHLPRTEGGSVEHVLGVDVSHVGSRFEVNAAHTRHVERLGTDQLQARTSINVGTGLAFADGQVAVGRPVRGAFAIVDTHESLAASDVHLDPFRETHRAATDGLGPLIVSNLSPYSPTALAYEVDNLPAGYDVGSGSFHFVAPYKSGFALSIGSDFAVTAMGVLMDAENKPLALKAGVASSAAQADKKVVFFTNSAGNFSVQGLKAGEWTIQMNDAQGTRYVMSIPTDATGFVELGELQPTVEARQ